MDGGDDEEAREGELYDDASDPDPDDDDDNWAICTFVGTTSFTGLMTLPRPQWIYYIKQSPITPTLTSYPIKLLFF